MILAGRSFKQLGARKGAEDGSNGNASLDETLGDFLRVLIADGILLDDEDEVGEGSHIDERVADEDGGKACVEADGENFAEGFVLVVDERAGIIHLIDFNIRMGV